MKNADGVGRERVSEGRNQWYVITGPPCCGKSTTVELLAQRGFQIRSEIARDYLDQEISNQRQIQEVLSDMRRFQREVFLRAVASEEALPTDKMIFLDRGIPDSLAYFNFYGIQAKPFR